MAEGSAVPLLVLTRHQDNVEVINSTLRNAGQAVRCLWVRDLNALARSLREHAAQLLIAFVGPDPADSGKVMAVCRQSNTDLPVLMAREQVDEDIIASAMQQGARDVVSMMNPVRLHAVVARELRAYQQTRALSSTIDSAREYREQLQNFMAGSADAIAIAQEGILVDANPAWLELYGLPDAQAILGTPLMDAFEPGSHAALKGALVACMQGRWSDHRLRAPALLSDGSTCMLDIELSGTEFDGEPAVRLCIGAQRRDGASLDERLDEALKRDSATGALQRRFFIQRLQQVLSAPLRGGVRQLLAIEPDQFNAIETALGPLLSEEFIAQFAEVVIQRAQPTDIIGRFGAATLVVLLERGTPADVQAWSNQLLRQLSSQTWRIGDKPVSCTASIGIATIDIQNNDVDGALNTALSDILAARVNAAAAGGARLEVAESRVQAQQQANDELWVTRIKAALKDNRLRLMRQPIASLMGEERSMFDVLVRMLAEDGAEWLPAQFMAAAQRNDLMKYIDRWVIGATMSCCASGSMRQLFVRLSADSVGDASLPQWLANQLKVIRVEPGRLVFQISEQVALSHTDATTILARTLQQAGFKFALEHFGLQPQGSTLLEHMTPDYIKIDGSLLPALGSDPQLRARIGEVVEYATARQIGTIAERVEDANTMAVLWQLGVQYIQGYFVHEPEQVVMG